MTELFLITGATGRHGGTGAHVAHRLRADGHRVRVLVRTRDERSSALEAAGFDVHVGDLSDRDSLLPALDGVTHATFCYPVNAGIVAAAASFASAVRSAAPAARVVVMSMIAAQPTSPSHLGRAQWLAEEVMTWAGLRLCVLRVAALFFENIVLLHGASIRERGAIRNCFGDVRAPWIAGEDAADLVVAALLHPERFGDAPISYPGPAALHAHAELASVLAGELSTRVTYESISLDEWRGELLSLAERSPATINKDMAQHISALGFALAKRGAMKAPEPAELERQLGHTPRSFRDFVRAHARALTPALSSQGGKEALAHAATISTEDLRLTDDFGSG